MKKAGMIIGSTILCLVAGILFFIGGKALVARVFDREPDEPVIKEIVIDVPAESLDGDGMLEVQEGERTNILLLGIDAREGETDARTDSMVFVSVDPKLKKGVVISIPRDTRVTINGSRDQKINAANMYGGVPLAKKKVEEMLNTKIDYYGKANFAGFAEIIDILGGVTIDVEQRMYYPEENIDLQPGLQTLNGYDALGYVRYRGYAMGDIARTEHQQNFIKALVARITQPSILVKIPKILGIIRASVETDIPMNKLVQMASWAPLFKREDVYTQTLPGYFLDVRDSAGTLLNSFWAADERIAKRLIEDMYKGKTYDTVTNANGMLETVGGGAAKTTTTEQDITKSGLLNEEGSYEAVKAREEENKAVQRIDRVTQEEEDEKEEKPDRSSERQEENAEEENADGTTSSTPTSSENEDDASHGKTEETENGGNGSGNGTESSNTSSGTEVQPPVTEPEPVAPVTTEPEPVPEPPAETYEAPVPVEEYTPPVEEPVIPDFNEDPFGAEHPQSS